MYVQSITKKNFSVKTDFVGLYNNQYIFVFWNKWSTKLHLCHFRVPKAFLRRKMRRVDFNGKISLDTFGLPIEWPDIFYNVCTSILKCKCDVKCTFEVTETEMNNKKYKSVR